MAAKEASFDVVSEVNMEEVKNAIQIALKELKNRFDFKGSIADIKLENDKLVVVAEDDYKVEQVKDILFGKLVKRNVPIKNIHFSESEKALGGTTRQYGDLISGIDKENAKKINTAIKNSGIKVKSQIQEDKIRVTGKSRDDLQKVMALLRELDLPMALEFNNYR
ncbi:YajQ family cyclic di-GMP-binding protein [Enterococcus faecalis]|uniref:YajQ family cyclic di-GMP-binding protein n=1 Tax=Enterococcus TaxID=1350 RepID=UPI001A08D1D4|nr:YajQ family cyclic di-GMP-binding protein [Enterococcus faecalis]EGO8395017.1 YajQ family cyclic di-GMP-binding protein [Enterococcus faecalis]EGO9443678.1 YajQ family cyclic di-GMP-binding protein [Enterococcus faecalis]EKJ5045050.1 YajQ family cyclic di-GMP-binding protein [Enterococcus faecalis]EKL7552807.1 YajQ family cyclic di-GMP-binding protein [Enterococcus faecalis]EKZ0098885.1 YajQ family cyclic di-GMP-binding protein [Enterococcus faecalis]